MFPHGRFEYQFKECQQPSVGDRLVSLFGCNKIGDSEVVEVIDSLDGTRFLIRTFCFRNYAVLNLAELEEYFRGFVKLCDFPPEYVI